MRCTAGGFQGCWPSVDAQNHGGGVSLFRKVDMKGAVLPEKVVNKSTSEATMINTGIGQPCDSDSSVPDTTGLKGCLLHGIKRLSQIKYPMCQ